MADLRGSGIWIRELFVRRIVNAQPNDAFDLYGRRKAMSLFAQDSYKMTPKLTLTGRSAVAVCVALPREVWALGELTT